MHDWTGSLALRNHMECVAACVTSYAEKLDSENAERWTVAGLLHDFDYEKHPTAEEHPFVGVKHLESLGVDEEIRTAILGHALYSGVARETPMAKALFACDELAGFIVAVGKVRPDGLDGMAPKSVKKKLKDKGFAAAVSREDIRIGLEELGPMAGVNESEHIANCIEAIRERVPDALMH
ncbi:MAG: HD domain-containing protein [Planctomycetota bacterium]